MRVTFVTGQIGAIGGVSRVILSQARYLAERGHVVNVVAPGRKATPLGPGVTHVPVTPSSSSLLRVIRTAQLVSMTRPDIAIAHVGMRDIASALSGRVARRLVIYSHGGPYLMDRNASQYDLREKFYSSGVVSAAYHAADLVITNSHWCSVFFTQNGIDAKVVYPGVDTEFFTPLSRLSSQQSLGMHSLDGSGPDERPLFVTVGFGPWKRNELLIDALSEVARSYPDVFATFIGRTPSLRIMNYAKQKGIASNVRLPGPIFDDKILRLWYSAATSYVHMYGLEQFGLPVAEAQSCGTTAIGPNSGGAAEIIEKSRTGLLFSDGDAESLAQQMLYVIEHPSETEEMGKAARRRAIENFDRMIVNRRLEKLLEDTLRTHSRPVQLPSP